MGKMDEKVIIYKTKNKVTKLIKRLSDRGGMSVFDFVQAFLNLDFTILIKVEYWDRMDDIFVFTTKKVQRKDLIKIDIEEYNKKTAGSYILEA